MSQIIGIGFLAASVAIFCLWWKISLLRQDMEAMSKRIAVLEHWRTGPQEQRAKESVQ